MSIYRIALRFASITLLLAVILPYALKVGIYWEGQAHPTEGVEVVLAGGEKITGVLSRNWNGSFTLTTSAGPREFTDFEMMTTPKLEGPVRNPWRIIFPPLLILLLCAQIEASMERYLTRREKKGDGQ
ncbi:hypothetical protein ACTG16_23170 [Aeromonas sp. 23P]|uniref:hypothetical protein n=1 Tax=Aeromonas sp. 23P TaxID=3452716 RepID=UPI003F7A3C76|nr:hypothetical protein [Aeromonas veronii]